MRIHAVDDLVTTVAHVWLEAEISNAAVLKALLGLNAAQT